MPSKKMKNQQQALTNSFKKDKLVQALKSKLKEEPDYSGDAEIAKYALAVMDPFNPGAVGARIPDISNVGTLTAKSEGIVQLSSNASGVCSFAISGNPQISFMDLTTASTTQATSSMSNWGAQSPYIYGAAAAGNLQAQFANMRVVGWGYRLRNQMPPTTAVGRVSWCCVPTSGDNVGYNNLLNTGVLSNDALFRQTGLQFGTSTVQLTSGAPASILTFPNSDEFSIQDVIAEAMEFVGKISDYDFVKFHTTNPSTQTGPTTNEGDSTVYGAALAVQTYSNLDVTNYRGWNNYIIRIEGLPASTVIGELDYIYHYEGGAPAPSSSLGIVTPDAELKTHVNTAAHNKVVDLSVVSNSVHLAEQMFMGDYLGAAKTLIGKKNTRLIKSKLQRTLFSKLGLQL